MRFVEEYRDPHRVAELSKLIHKTTTRPWTIMEVCGGQTHAILKFGIDRLLPPEITLVHGPGCPVCVTPVSVIDAAVEIASRPDVIFCSFGDMLRVPGSNGDLFEARAAGADLRIVYSPLDALAVARSNPGRQVVFLAVGAYAARRSPLGRWFDLCDAPAGEGFRAFLDLGASAVSPSAAACQALEIVSQRVAPLWCPHVVKGLRCPVPRQQAFGAQSLEHAFLQSHRRSLRHIVQYTSLEDNNPGVYGVQP